MRELTAQGQWVIGTYATHPQDGLKRLDMTDPNAVAQMMAAIEPDVVWAPGAMPDVDRCEREPELSYAANVQGPKNVLEHVADRHRPLVYFSTDYVFDGVCGPYRETDTTHPVQVYGAHKAEAEQALLQYAETLVVRPAWIYSDEPNPRNFVFRVLSDLKEGRPIKSASDQYSTPTPAGPLVRQAMKALNQGMRGILHLTGSERMSRLALVRRIAEKAGYSVQHIEPIRTGDLPLAAKRPLNGGLITNFPALAISDRLEDLDFRPLLTRI